MCKCIMVARVQMILLCRCPQFAIDTHVMANWVRDGYFLMEHWVDDYLF